MFWHRPSANPRVFLTADWRYLAMINFEADAALLQPWVPPGTELDTWNGHTILSVVGLLFFRTRVLGVPVPGHVDFPEVNLRFYVRYRGPEGWRRGVVFLKEIVPLRAVTVVARLLYNEQYVTRPMRYQVDLEGDRLRPEGGIRYEWFDRGRWHELRMKTEGEAQPMLEGSEEQFVAEHYWGYVTQRNGISVEYTVEHPPWRVWKASEYSFDCDVAQVYGEQYVQCLSAAPTSAFLAEGSQVVVRRGVRI